MTGSVAGRVTQAGRPPPARAGRLSAAPLRVPGPGRGGRAKEADRARVSDCQPVRRTVGTAGPAAPWPGPPAGAAAAAARAAPAGSLSLSLPRSASAAVTVTVAAAPRSVRSVRVAAGREPESRSHRGTVTPVAPCRTEPSPSHRDRDSDWLPLSPHGGRWHGHGHGHPVPAATVTQWHTGLDSFGVTVTPGAPAAGNGPGPRRPPGGRRPGRGGGGRDRDCATESDRAAPVTVTVAAGPAQW